MLDLRFYSNLLRHVFLGPKATKDYLENESKTWTLEELTHESSGSSLSDNDDYTSIVSAGLKDEYFGSFRSSREYTDVLEHVSVR